LIVAERRSRRLGELFVGGRLPPSPARAGLLGRREPVGDRFWRCSIARISGGQMNLTVNQMKSAKARRLRDQGQGEFM